MERKESNSKNNSDIEILENSGMKPKHIEITVVALIVLGMLAIISSVLLLSEEGRFIGYWNGEPVDEEYRIVAVNTASGVIYMVYKEYDISDRIGHVLYLLMGLTLLWLAHEWWECRRALRRKALRRKAYMALILAILVFSNQLTWWSFFFLIALTPFVGIASRQKTNGTTEKKRGALLTIWLILMLLANAGTALGYLLEGGFITAVLPTIPSWAIYVLGVVTLLNVVFTIFLFMWKKWAFFALCGTAGLAFVINLIIGMGFYSVFGLLGLIILYLILSPKWNLLE